jgi:adenosylcobinamide-phosphate synthase
MMAEYLFIALAGGVTIDFLFGDPSNRYHPVAWLGRFIGFFVPKLKDNSNNSAKKERVKGLIFTTSLIITFGVVIHSIVFTTLHLLGAADVIIFSTIILKITISIRGMEKHARVIMSALKRSDLENAQYNLSMIVRRNTKTLDEQHVISGIIECISESTVDGIVSPLFYYSFFGPAGAFIYRIINTLDSMLGYKDNYYQNIGWMSARLDTIANYIPARITAFLMIISAGIIGADWKNSLQILQRDHNKTFSPNA